MAESTQEAIQRLLAEGLEHYGTGQVSQAVRLWRQVLALDPENAEAREYLETAEDEAGDAPNAGSAAAAAPADATATLLEEAQARLRADDAETALELFETVAERDSERLEVHGYVDMVRSRLLKQYRERLGNGLPSLKLTPEQLMKYNLPADAGFLLAMIDGHTPVNDLISLSGMDEFRVLRNLAQMLDAGIVEVPL